MTAATAAYGINTSYDVMIPMRDGVRLAADIYWPALSSGERAPGPFPTILGRTAYSKQNGPQWVDSVARFFTPQGYVTVLEDIRGRGNSGGTGGYGHVYNKNEGRDGYDTIEWIAAQSWSNGRVGMVGSSHNANVQNVAALHRPPHLTALWIDVTRTSGFHNMPRHGGALMLTMVGAIFLHLHDAQEVRDDPAAQAWIARTLENFREYLWWPGFKRGQSPLSLVPSLEDVYFHYIHDTTYSDWWKDESIGQKPHFHRFADIPITFSGGWNDPFVADNSEEYVILRAQNKSPMRLIIGPWNHVAMHGNGSSVVGEVDFGPTAHWGDHVYNQERLRWFDRWLRDIDTGVEKDPPVRVFVMGGGGGTRTVRGHLLHGGQWRTEKAWPIARAVDTPFYLAADGGLSRAEVPAEGAVSWVHDPKNPVPSLGGTVTGFYEWLKIPEGFKSELIPARARMRTIVPDGPLHQRERADQVGCRPPYPLLGERPDVMVFQTPPLASDVEVTGPINVRLWVSSTALDTDITVKLLDIYPRSPAWPDGFHMPLCDSILRLRFREGFEREVLMTPGTVYEITIALPPVSNLFVAGNRIRLDVASANFPKFDINPNTGEPLARHTHSLPATNTVHFGRSHPSAMTLPVVPTG